MFRILPGSPEECSNGKSEYDPRIRPWYVAASSGPKDVILVLDTSQSMESQGRLGIMKEAATRVINTLGVGDYFKVVAFDSRAEYVGSSPPPDNNDWNYNINHMWRATNENKEQMVKNIDELKPFGQTNFTAGFDLAFQTLKSSSIAEKESGCHRAILFLTDGISREHVATLLNYINTQLSELEASGSRPVIFTYSFGTKANEDDIPKRIACENDGIWSSIRDGGDLAKSMGAYYKYFAYGLSETGNENFVAWVAPYIFATSGEIGTTASAPVYDRSVEPPVLAGVVGIDFSFNAMERALGEEGQKSKDAVLQKIVDRSGATCPNLELTPCQLQSLREYGIDDDSNSAALCDNVVDANGSNCNTSALKSPLCPSSNLQSAYPYEFWNNDKNKDRTYEEKTCCTVGEAPREANQLTDAEVKSLVCTNSPSATPSLMSSVAPSSTPSTKINSTSTGSKSNVGLIVSSTLAGIIGVISLLAAGRWWFKKRGNTLSPASGNNNEGNSTPSSLMVSTLSAATNGNGNLVNSTSGNNNVENPTSSSLREDTLSAATSGNGNMENSTSENNFVENPTSSPLRVTTLSAATSGNGNMENSTSENNNEENSVSGNNNVETPTPSSFRVSALSAVSGNGNLENTIPPPRVHAPIDLNRLESLDPNSC